MSPANARERVVNNLKPRLNLDKETLKFICESGEGQFVEFKESPDKSLAKEIVAFANASGGSIYLGISDNGAVKGIKISNNMKLRNLPGRNTLNIRKALTERQ